MTRIQISERQIDKRQSLITVKLWLSVTLARRRSSESFDSVRCATYFRLQGSERVSVAKLRGDADRYAYSRIPMLCPPLRVYRCFPGYACSHCQIGVAEALDVSTTVGTFPPSETGSKALLSTEPTARPTIVDLRRRFQSEPPQL